MNEKTVKAKLQVLGEKIDEMSKVALECSKRLERILQTARGKHRE